MHFIELPIWPIDDTEEMMLLIDLEGISHIREDDENPQWTRLYIAGSNDHYQCTLSYTAVKQRVLEMQK